MEGEGGKERKQKNESGQGTEEKFESDELGQRKMGTVMMGKTLCVSSGE